MPPSVKTLLTCLVAFLALFGPAYAADVLELGDRRELFVDGRPIDRLVDTRLVQHAPQPREVVLKLDRPWEGIYSGYYTVL